MAAAREGEKVWEREKTGAANVRKGVDDERNAADGDMEGADGESFLEWCRG